MLAHVGWRFRLDEPNFNVIVQLEVILIMRITSVNGKKWIEGRQEAPEKEGKRRKIRFATCFDST